MLKRIVLSILVYGGLTGIIIGSFKIHEGFGYIMLGLVLFITGWAVKEIYFK